MGLTEAQWNALALRRSELARVLGRWRDALKRAALDVEDLVQDTLARAWRYRHRFDEGVSSAWGWLCMIGHRLASTATKRRTRDEQKATVRCALTGPVPYGFATVDGQLVEAPAEQSFLALIRGRVGGGAVTRAVVRLVNEEGHRTRTGRPWSRSSLSAALARTA